MTHIFKRINDVITANINDLIDRVEDPERMIKQVIREMEDNIAKARESVVEAIANEKQLHRELESNQKQMQEWLGKAEVAINKGDEDLARMALSRKKEHENIVKVLEPSWESARNTSERLKTQLRALEAKLEEARRKRSSLAARQHAAQARQKMDQTLASFEAGINARNKFERMEDKVASMEARTEAMEELRNESDQLEKDFLEMETKDEIEDELQALKDRVNKKQGD